MAARPRSSLYWNSHNTGSIVDSLCNAIRSGYWKTGGGSDEKCRYCNDCFGEMHFDGGLEAGVILGSVK